MEKIRIRAGGPRFLMSFRRSLLAVVLGAATLPCGAVAPPPATSSPTSTVSEPFTVASPVAGLPAWILRVPQNPDLYIGIGKGDKRTRPDDYRDMARSAALAQISREISVRVKAENVSVVSENDAGREERYGQRIHATSENDLSGYEVADTYETPEVYWTLYTLDKEVFRRWGEARENEFSEWLRAETLAINSDLVARRLPDALRRFIRVRAKYDSASANFPGVRTGEVSARFGILAAKVEVMMQGIGLGVEPSTWVWSWRNPTSESPRVFPIGPDGKKFAGKLDLILADETPGHPACRVVTDAVGAIDLRRPFRECGLAPGNWSVTWMLPEGSVESRVRADVKAEDVLFTVPTDAAVLETEARQLKNDLAGMGGPYFRLVPVQSDAEFEIHLQSKELDSLEGMYFATVSGRLNHGGQSLEISGKAGHASPQRARRLAMRDFALEVEKNLKR